MDQHSSSDSETEWEDDDDTVILTPWSQTNTKDDRSLARLSQPDIYTTDITQQRNSQQVVKIFTSEQFKNWVSGPKIILHTADSIPNIFSTKLLDVANGRAKICIKEGISNMVSSTELYEELQKSIKQNKTNYSKIGSGYTKVKSSRFQLEENHFSTNRAFPQLNAVFKGFASDLRSYLNKEENKSLHTYQIENASVLWDTTYRPHYQKPHCDFKLSSFVQKNVTMYPMGVLHAMENVTILVYLREENEFAATYPSKLFLKAGQTMFFAYNLWHAGDMLCRYYILIYTF